MSLLGKKILSLGTRSERKSAGSKAQKGFLQAKSVGILFSWQDAQKEAEVLAFIDEIKAGRNIQCLCFNPDKKAEVHSQFPVFSLASLSMLGKIDSEETNRFLQQPFDYLFHLDLDLNDITKALLSKSQAQCRVGLHSIEGEKYFELMIGINKNAGLHNFASQILKYVNALK